MSYGTTHRPDESELMCQMLAEKQAHITKQQAIIDALVKALEVAHGLIISHHNCSKPIQLGQFCPHCHKEDGSEPELDQIANALKLAKEQK